MKRPIRPEELQLWSMVAATVHPMPGRKVPKAEDAPATVIDPKAPAARIPPPAPKPAPPWR